MRWLIALLAVLQCLLLLVGFVADNAVNAPAAEYAGQAVTASVPDALITGQELRQRGEVEVVATGARVHIRELRPLLPLGEKALDLGLLPIEIKIESIDTQGLLGVNNIQLKPGLQLQDPGELVILLDLKVAETQTAFPLEVIQFL